MAASYSRRPSKHHPRTSADQTGPPSLPASSCPIGRVINDVFEYLFDGDSYFAVFYTYKNEYITFFPKFHGSALWIFISKKFGEGEDQNIFC